MMKEKPVTIEQMLGTKDRGEQARRVQALVTAPVVDVIVRLDQRSGQVSVAVLGVGGQVALEGVLEILEQGRQTLLRQAIQGRQNGGEQKLPTDYTSREEQSKDAQG
jgi:hypothetical protein